MLSRTRLASAGRAWRVTAAARALNSTGLAAVSCPRELPPATRQLPSTGGQAKTTGSWSLPLGRPTAKSTCAGPIWAPRGGTGRPRHVLRGLTTVEKLPSWPRVQAALASGTTTIEHYGPMTERASGNWLALNIYFHRTDWGVKIVKLGGVMNKHILGNELDHIDHDHRKRLTDDTQK